MRPLRWLARALGVTTKVLIALLIVAVVSPVAAAGVGLATQLFVPLPATLPERTELEVVRFSEVYDVNGQLIHTYRQFDQNIPVTPGDIPTVVKNAVIAAEDRNFYSHGGVDVRGTVRALITDVRAGELVQGGSTITQQLAKNAYGAGSERTLERKVREAILASQLDRSLSKEQILYEYLTIVYYGEGAYGIGAAAHVYFQKPINNVTLSEAALMAAVIPAPSRFNPRADLAAAEIRRKAVLDSMLDEEMITFDEWNVAKDQVVWLEEQGEPTGPVTLIRSRKQENTRYPWYIQYLTSFLAEKLGDEDILYRGGLQIFTPFDPELQHEAEVSVFEQLKDIDPRISVDHATGVETQHLMQMSITAVEPPTGFVRAMVGGRDFNLTQANLATGAGSPGKQPGSSFKPFVLAEAFEQGITPGTVYSGGPLRIGDYEPQNYGGARYGSMTLRSAMHRSVNTVFVRLIRDVGPYEVVETANRLGLGIKEIDPSFDGSGLSIALGSREVTTMGMASAFGTFGNGGLRVPPTPVVRVFDPDGEVVLDFSEPRGEQVFREATADNVTDVFRGVITSGTARGRSIGRPAAGKTGTTQDNKDGWFVGYTPSLSTAVMMGWDPQPPAGQVWRVKGRALTGGSFPAATWQKFMETALDGVPITDFDEPAPIRDIESEEMQRERRGFGPGPAMRRSVTPGVDLVVVPGRPQAPAPTTTTTTTPSTTTSTSTTTTTRPDDLLFPPGSANASRNQSGKPP